MHHSCPRFIPSKHTFWYSICDILRNIVVDSYISNTFHSFHRYNAALGNYSNEADFLNRL